MAVALAGLAVAAYGASQSGNAQNSANQQNQQNQQAQLNWNKSQDPFSAGGNRAQYVPQLNALMQGGAAGVAGDPMFQKQNQQSMQDMQRGMSARGLGASGQEMTAMADNSWKNQQDYFNQQYSRLSDLSGANRGGGSAATGQSGQQAYGQSLGTSNQMGQAIGQGVNSLNSIFGQGSNDQSLGATNGGTGTAGSGMTTSMPNQNSNPWG